MFCALSAREIIIFHAGTDSEWTGLRCITGAWDPRTMEVLLPRQARSNPSSTFFVFWHKNMHLQKCLTFEVHIIPVLGWEVQWTWVWASSMSWWWTEKPGVLQSMGSQRVGLNWVTELGPPGAALYPPLAAKMLSAKLETWWIFLGKLPHLPQNDLKKLVWEGPQWNKPTAL